MSERELSFDTILHSGLEKQTAGQAGMKVKKAGGGDVTFATKKGSPHN